MEEYEGVSLVTLPDDSDDVKGLLGMLYDPSLVPILNQSSRDWQSHLKRILGPLRLAGKYELTKLRDHLVKILSLLWPRRLRDWDERQRLLTSDKWDLDEPPAKRRRPIPTPLIAQVINVAHEVNATDILPVAYYELHTACTIDRTVAYYDNSNNDIEKVIDNTYSFSNLLGDLPAPILCHIMEGREALRVLAFQMATKVIWEHLDEDDNEDCEMPDAEKCHCSLESWWDFPRIDDTKMFESLLFGDPLRWLRDLHKSLEIDRRRDADWVSFFNCRFALGSFIDADIYGAWSRYSSG